MALAYEIVVLLLSLLQVVLLYLRLLWVEIFFLVLLLHYHLLQNINLI